MLFARGHLNLYLSALAASPLELLLSPSRFFSSCSLSLPFEFWQPSRVPWEQLFVYSAAFRDFDLNFLEPHSPEEKQGKYWVEDMQLFFCTCWDVCSWKPERKFSVFSRFSILHARVILNLFVINSTLSGFFQTTFSVNNLRISLKCICKYSRTSWANALSAKIPLQTRPSLFSSLLFSIFTTFSQAFPLSPSFYRDCSPENPTGFAASLFCVADRMSCPLFVPIVSEWGEKFFIHPQSGIFPCRFSWIISSPTLSNSSDLGLWILMEKNPAFLIKKMILPISSQFLLLQIMKNIYDYEFEPQIRSLQR